MNAQKNYNNISAPADVGSQIRIRRQALKMTQEELAKKLKLTKAAVSRYEKNLVKVIPLDVRIELARILNCSPHLFKQTHAGVDVNVSQLDTMRNNIVEMLNDYMDMIQLPQKKILHDGQNVYSTKMLDTGRFIIIDRNAWQKEYADDLLHFIGYTLEKQKRLDEQMLTIDAEIKKEINEQNKRMKEREAEMKQCLDAMPESAKKLLKEREAEWTDEES